MTETGPILPLNFTNVRLVLFLLTLINSASVQKVCIFQPSTKWTWNNHVNWKSHGQKIAKSVGTLQAGVQALSRSN